MKVFFLLGGYGRRMRPISYFVPKCLLPLGGKPILGRILDQFKAINLNNSRFFFIVNKKNAKPIHRYLRKYNSYINTTIIFQKEANGQSGALVAAKEYLSGPCMIVFPDTLVEYDLSPFFYPPAGNFVWTYRVDDISKLGSVVLNEMGNVRYIAEKTGEQKSGSAVTGYYYFNEGAQLRYGIEDQEDLKIMRNDEFYLSDAVNLLLNEFLTMKTIEVDKYVTIDTPMSWIKANRDWRKK